MVRFVNYEEEPSEMQIDSDFSILDFMLLDIVRMLRVLLHSKGKEILDRLILSVQDNSMCHNCHKIRALAMASTVSQHSDWLRCMRKPTTN